MLNETSHFKQPRLVQKLGVCEATEPMWWQHQNADFFFQQTLHSKISDNTKYRTPIHWLITNHHFPIMFPSFSHLNIAIPAGEKPDHGAESVPAPARVGRPLRKLREEFPGNVHREKKWPSLRDTFGSFLCFSVVQFKWLCRDTSNWQPQDSRPFGSVRKVNKGKIDHDHFNRA